MSDASSNSSQQTRVFARKPFFRRDPTTSILATIGIFFLSQIIAAILINMYPLLQNWTDQQATDWLSDSVAAQFSYILLAEVFAIAMVYYLLRWARVTWARIGWTSLHLKDVGYALVAYGLYFLVYLVVIVLATQLIPALDADQEQQIGFENAQSYIELMMTFVSLVILPSIAEEIIFRGFLFTSLRAKFRLRYAVIATSILFGIAHLQFGADAPLLWVAAIDTFVLSCFLCILRERSGSLWAPIFLHAIKNSVVFASLFGQRF
jgi:membrane protease YdiL (CAAX protease family)